MKRLRDIGELALIRRLQKSAAGRGRGVIQGIGDDCAVVRPAPDSPLDLLLTSDPVIEGVHFEAQDPPEWIGAKAVGRGLSDLAAMGGQPLWALIDLVAPRQPPLTRIAAVYRGARKAMRKHGLTLVGGDTTAGPRLELHAFVVGGVPRGTAVLRSGARPGDILYVTGSLGGSRRGKHLRFTPRVREGQWLREGRWATAMIDISDGLATDLRHLTDMSGTGARLQLDAIPVSRAANAVRNNRSALAHALYDGEDFELLFTVSKRKTRAFEPAWKSRFDLPCTAIGVMTQQAGANECAQADGVTVLTKAGWEHFRR